MSLSFKSDINRNRVLYFTAIILVVMSGLLSRRYSEVLPQWIGVYAGDVLWALMVYLIIGFIFKRLSSIKTVLAATAFSYFIEFTQLYHAPWIDGIRKTKLGALVLGFGFMWSDLLCYLFGIIIGMCLEKITQGMYRE